MEQSTEESLIREILLDPRLNLIQDQIPLNAVPNFLAYTRLWHKWNSKISLTAEKDPVLFIKNHLFVSLQFVRAVKEAQGIIDIGSGAGLPGVPLKIMLPRLPTLLVECRRKRASFLMTVVRELGLGSIEVADSKVESMGPVKIPADTVVLRAVADTPTCIQWARGVLPDGGRLVLLRTLKEAGTPDLPDPALKGKEIFPVVDFQDNPLALIAYQI